MRSLVAALPALFAAVLLAVSPGCAAVRPEGPPAVQRPHAPPAESRVQPRAPDDISGIERGAGEWCPSTAPNADAWAALFVYGAYLLYMIGYGIAWCFVSLAEIIDDSLDSAYVEDCDEDCADCKADCKEEAGASSP